MRTWSVKQDGHWFQGAFPVTLDLVNGFRNECNKMEFFEEEWIDFLDFFDECMLECGGRYRFDYIIDIDNNLIVYIDTKDQWHALFNILTTDYIF